MSLINCPECGHQVSTLAKTCPNCGAPIVNTTVNKTKRKWMIIAASFVLGVALFGGVFYLYHTSKVQDERHAFENAKLSNEPAVLQSFLDTYVDAPAEHRDSIHMLLAAMKSADLEWSNAVASASKSALQAYMRQHPGDVHNTEALLLIDSLDWVTAQSRNTEDAYRLYMSAHSDGTYYDEARIAYEGMESARLAREQAVRDSLAAIDDAQ